MTETVDFLIRGERVYAQGNFSPLAVAVRDEKIVAITDPANAPPAREVYDAGHNPVLPGIIDPHTHMREPGYTQREDWTNGTRASAAGGVTCVIEHPNSVPPVNCAENFRYKREIAAAKAVVDFALYGGAGEGTIDTMEEQAEEGAVAFKTFLWPYPDRSDEFEGIYTVDDGVLYQIFEKVAQLGMISSVHAESYYLVRMFSARMERESRRAPIEHEKSRPVIAEVEAVWRTMLLAHETGARLNLLHISSGSGATAKKLFTQVYGLEPSESLREGQSGHKGVFGKITVETCPTYLALTEDHLQQIGPYGKINPPLRNLEEQTLLWERVADGTVDTIGSDHGPHEFAAKEKGWEDIAAAPAGAPGVETSLPVMLTQVHTGRLSLERLVELMSVNVARLYELYPRKGAIAVGSDADFVVVDQERRGQVDPNRLHAQDPRVARMFEGKETVGAPILTVVRGRVVMRDGEVVGAPGDGKFIAPSR